MPGMQHLADYINFADNKEMNEHVKRHLRKQRPYINDTDFKVLEAISRHAVKYPGAAHLRYKTLKKITGKSEATLYRTIKKLDGLGIIKKIATTRVKSGGDGANIIVIQRCDEAPESPSDDARDHDDAVRVKKPRAISEDKATSKATNKKHKSTNDTQRRHKPILPRPLEARTEPDPMDSTFLRGSIPSALYEALSPYFTAGDLYAVVGTIFKAKKAYQGAEPVTIEDNAGLFSDALKGVIRRYKGGHVADLQAYVYATIARITGEINRRMRRNHNADLYAWIGG